MQIQRTTLMGTLLWLLAGLTAGCDDKGDDIGGEEGGTTDDPQDQDGDGYLGDEDCDDAKSTIYPGAPEVCDEVDNDCDGTTDEDAGYTFYLDADGDGVGIETQTLMGCTPPDGYAEGFGDCDDTNATMFPGNLTDGCDELDNDCDGTADEDVAYQTYYIDADHDGYGDDAKSISACAPPTDGQSAWVQIVGDCDDADDDTYPGAGERCDKLDNDCDEQVDNDLVEFWYPDADGDGFGESGNWIEDCDPDEGYVDNRYDCDDDSVEVRPGAVEVCDKVDNNCNNEVDEESCYNTWTGVTNFEYGLFYEPYDRDCVLEWDTHGERIATFCEGCEFAFEVTHVYNETTSEDNGFCSVLHTNFSYKYAYMPDYLGYEALMYQYYYNGIPYTFMWGLAQMNEANAVIEFSSYPGYEDLYIPEYGYYYTNVWEGEAVLK